MRPKALVILMSALLFAGRSLAQSGDASVTLSADKDHIVVGEEARVTLSLQHNSGLSQVKWPAVPDSFGKIEILRKDRIDTIRQGAFTRYRQVWFVTGFDSGMN